MREELAISGRYETTEAVVGFERFDLRADSGNATYSLQLLQALLKVLPSWRFELVQRIRERFPPPKWVLDSPQCIVHSRLLHPLALGPLAEQWIIRRNHRQIRKLARQWNLMHVTNPLYYVFDLPVPSVVTIHDLISLEYPQWVAPGSVRFYRTYIRSIIADARWIFANSYYTAERICDHFPAAEQKLSVTPLAANPQFQPQPVSDHFLARYQVHRPYILHVGEIQPRKNLHGLLQAFARIAQAVPSVQLVLIGRATRQWYLQELQQFVAQHALDERVRILGRRTTEEIAKFYAAATVFCYPAFVEGFGLPVLEAMQSGTAVITSESTALAEVAGDAALLVNPYQVSQLAEALVAVLQSDTLRQQLEMKGLQRAQQFSWEKTAQQTAAGYRTVLSEHWRKENSPVSL